MYQTPDPDPPAPDPDPDPDPPASPSPSPDPDPPTGVCDLSNSSSLGTYVLGASVVNGSIYPSSLTSPTAVGGYIFKVKALGSNIRLFAMDMNASIHNITLYRAILNSSGGFTTPGGYYQSSSWNTVGTWSPTTWSAGGGIPSSPISLISSTPYTDICAGQEAIFYLNFSGSVIVDRTPNQSSSAAIYSDSNMQFGWGFGLYGGSGSSLGSPFLSGYPNYYCDPTWLRLSYHVMS